MALTPAALARQRQLAAIAKPSEDNDAELIFDDETQKIVHLFRQHQAALKNIRSDVAKEVEKAAILPDFAGYIAGFMENPEPDPVNQIFALLTLWTIDAGQLDEAAPMIEFSLAHKLALPESFQRPLAEAFTEELTKKAQAGNEIGIAGLDMIDKAIAVADINDKVRARFYKLYAEKVEADQPEQALELYKVAVKLDKNVGVKPKIAELEKALKASAENKE